MDLDRDLAAAFEHAPTALVVSTPDGRVLRENAAARALEGSYEGEVRRASSHFAGADGGQLVVTAFGGLVDESGYHDPLTGLPNRTLFAEHLALGVARADRDRCAVAVLAIDLDDFERLNDTHGQAVGDEVLRRVAQRLQSAARLSDAAARAGGDEFLVLVGDLGRKVSVPAAEGIALRIEDALAAPFEVDGLSVQCTATIGVAVYPKQVRNAEKLIAAAETAVALRKRERNAA